MLSDPTLCAMWEKELKIMSDRIVHPNPYTISLKPNTCTLHPTPCILHPLPYILYPIPENRNPKS